MKNQVISNEELRKLKRNKKSIYGYEGKYYNFNDKILKLYLSDELKIREEVIDKLFASEKISNFLYPEEKAYFKNKFQGIILPTLDDYRTLFCSIDNDEITYKERLNHLSKITKCIKELHENGFAYFNLNLNKIVIAKNNVMLIEGDECYTKEWLKHKNFEDAKSVDQYSLMITSLSYMYRFNFQRYIIKNGVEEFKNILPLFPLGDDAINYIHNVVNKEVEEKEYVDNYLNDFRTKTCKKQRILR